MESESKYLGKTEVCYETEYDLRQWIHSRVGEILRLEYINAKQGREIERLNARISTILETSAILETTPGISDEVWEKGSDKIDRITELKNLFEYLKALLIKLSHKGENTPINPDDIDVKYIEAASRYCYPVLFDKYAILDQDDSIKDKVQLANDILHKFGLTEIYEYENLINSGEIDFVCVGRREYLDCARKMPSGDPNEEPILTHMGGDTKLNKW